jgi:hypothetical protein
LSRPAFAPRPVQRIKLSRCLGDCELGRLVAKSYSRRLDPATDYRPVTPVHGGLRRYILHRILRDPPCPMFPISIVRATASRSESATRGILQMWPSLRLRPLASYAWEGRVRATNSRTSTGLRRGSCPARGGVTYRRQQEEGRLLAGRYLSAGWPSDSNGSSENERVHGSAMTLAIHGCGPGRRWSQTSTSFPRIESYQAARSSL